MTHAEPHARVNIKYNHANSKATYLVSLSRCHEYILNESLIPSFEIHTNLYEPDNSNRPIPNYRSWVELD